MITETKTRGKITRPKKLDDLREGDLVEVVYPLFISAHDGATNIGDLRVYFKKCGNSLEFIKGTPTEGAPLTIESHLVNESAITLSEIGQIEYGALRIVRHNCDVSQMENANPNYRNRFYALKEAGQIFLR